MALRLRVIGAHATQLGNSSSKVFGVHGGTVGRGQDNDWTLPDPERYLSGHHARIDYREGSYWLTDTSSNGTYVNESQEPLAGNGPYVLRDGDRLRMGEFDMLVSIDAANDFPPDDSAIVAYDGMGDSSAIRDSTEHDIDASLNLDALLSIDSEPMAPVNAWGQAVESAAIANPTSPGRARAPRRTTTAVPPPDVSEKSPSKAVPWNLATRRIEPYRNPLGAAGGAKSAADGSDVQGLHALCRGAGIDPASLPATVQPQVLQLAGQVLREVMMGLMEVSQGRTDVKNRFRIAQPTVQSSDNNPLQFSAGVDEALLKLFESFVKPSSRYLGPVEAVRDSFNEIKNHQQATHAAMQTAFVEFISRMEPTELQERFDRGLKRGGILAATNKTKYWELYAELYQTLSQAPKNELPHLFVEEFAKAYESKLADLNARKPRGGS